MVVGVVILVAHSLVIKDTSPEARICWDPTLDLLLTNYVIWGNVLTSLPPFLIRKGEVIAYCSWRVAMKINFNEYNCKV